MTRIRKNGLDTVDNPSGLRLRGEFAQVPLGPRVKDHKVILGDDRHRVKPQWTSDLEQPGSAEDIAAIVQHNLDVRAKRNRLDVATASAEALKEGRGDTLPMWGPDPLKDAWIDADGQPHSVLNSALVQAMQKHYPGRVPETTRSRLDEAFDKIRVSRDTLFKGQTTLGETSQTLRRNRDAVAPLFDPALRRGAPHVPSSRIFTEVEDLATRVEMAAAFKRWVTGDLRLERASHSLAHKAIQALKLRVIDTDADLDVPLQCLLVQHDWAALFGSNTGDVSGEWLLPCERVCFEFMISGWHVCAFMLRFDDGGLVTLACRQPGHERWITDRVQYCFNHEAWGFAKEQEILVRQGEPEVNAGLDRLVGLIFVQARAIAIMLEAEVVYAEPMRTPYRPNEPPRMADGSPLPKLSHHQVSLVPRVRALPREVHDAFPDRRRPRLHFRRAHDRHYANHKVRIAWTLAGNPELGWVDKEYRL